jgi:D-alanyl-D-alanine carboxypeptidase
MAAGFRTIILAGLAIGGVVLPDLKVNDAVLIQDNRIQALGVNAEPFGALHATVIAKRALPDADAGQTRPEELAEPEEREATLADPLQIRAPESPPVQIALLTPDQVHHDGKEEPDDIKTADECLASELCIDQYLWSLYQRARKVDTIKVVEQKKASVVKKGKLQTIIQKVLKLVREDFTWKDPAAAEKAGMPEMEYVIGGMDRGFRLRLYHALRAMDEAGLAPGITSGFRDDYRQSLASGLKAATNRSYHGGSLRGGYSHGLAVDLVSANGESDAERWNSNEKLWNWIDAHGKDFGIGRPYLDKDPAHVAPIDGQEYAAHRRGGKQYADHRRGGNTKQALQ